MRVGQGIACEQRVESTGTYVAPAGMWRTFSALSCRQMCEPMRVVAAAMSLVGLGVVGVV